ncbi:hypothetical protein [Listeria booriae]|uniref:Uncharacterized protein n=1 Tax=Listeria booriae TaxID=1552123 RepID=A0A7X0ZX65_9LIST|nr:hypothetical protein [Listeria booriae]MBC2312066.1 hypothetical protein [Listeria booriae]MBC6164700.1 hypothetical protein [Listeria booriae]
MEQENELDLLNQLDSQSLQQEMDTTKIAAEEQQTAIEKIGEDIRQTSAPVGDYVNVYRGAGSVLPSAVHEQELKQEEARVASKHKVEERTVEKDNKFYIKNDGERMPLDIAQEDYPKLADGYVVITPSGHEIEVKGFNSEIYQNPMEQLQTEYVEKITPEDLKHLTNEIEQSYKKDYKEEIKNQLSQTKDLQTMDAKQNEIEEQMEGRTEEEIEFKALYKNQVKSYLVKDNPLNKSEGSKLPEVTEKERQEREQRLKKFEEKHSFSKVYSLKMEALNELKNDPDLTKEQKKAIDAIKKALDERKQAQIVTQDKRTERNKKEGMLAGIKALGRKR